jgi:hypothetical protein
MNQNSCHIQNGLETIAVSWVTGETSKGLATVAVSLATVAVSLATGKTSERSFYLNIINDTKLIKALSERNGNRLLKDGTPCPPHWIFLFH